MFLIRSFVILCISFLLLACGESQINGVYETNYKKLSNQQRVETMQKFSMRTQAREEAFAKNQHDYNNSQDLKKQQDVL